MPPTFGPRCWAALVGKWPDLQLKEAQTAYLIIEGALQAFNRVVPDATGIPPHPEHVRTYFRDYELGDPEDFLDHYTATGWTIKGTSRRIKDWQAAARLWARRSARFNTTASKAAVSSASLFSMQSELKKVETEMESILYPGGSPYKVTPQGDKLARYMILQAQRQGLLDKIGRFAIS